MKWRKQWNIGRGVKRFIAIFRMRVWLWVSLILQIMYYRHFLWLFRQQNPQTEWMTMMAHWKIAVWICFPIFQLLTIVRGFEHSTSLWEESRPNSELLVISTAEQIRWDPVTMSDVGSSEHQRRGHCDRHRRRGAWMSRWRRGNNDHRDHTQETWKGRATTKWFINKSNLW